MKLSKEQKPIRFVLPAGWACYLTNDDATGYGDKELSEIENFLNTQSSAKDGLHCVGCGELAWFAIRNDANSLGGEVKVFSFIKITEQ